VETIGSKRSYALIWCMPNNDDDDDVSVPLSFSALSLLFRQEEGKKSLLQNVWDDC